MIKKVFIVGTFSFPSGQAASARMAQLALGFSDHVESVKVLSVFGQGVHTRPKHWNTLKNEKEVPYYYNSSYDFQGSSTLLRLKNRLVQFVSQKSILEELDKQLSGQNDELIFAYGRSYHFMNGLLKKKRKCGWNAKLVFDIVEPPHEQESFLAYLKHPFALDSKWALNERIIGGFDGCTFITKSLFNRFQDFCQSGIIVPSMMYPSASTPVLDQNQKNSTKKDDEIHIGYLGSLLKKDHPKLLLDLGTHLNSLGIPLKIHIVGRFDMFEEGRMWKNKFLKSSISEKIVFHSNPSDVERDRLLANFDYLAMFRYPDQLQRDTFPTRVVELLKANKPLLLNIFGDLGLYFEHRQNCIEVDPDNLPSLELWNAITGKSALKEITEGGKELLNTRFSSKAQAKSILEWMTNEAK